MTSMNTNAIINIAKAQLALEEDDYRAMLVRVTGRDSLRAMSERQKLDVVDELKRRGFRVQVQGKKLPPSVKPYVRMIHALWGSCYRLGEIEDGSRAALRTFCGRFAGGNDTVVVDPDHLSYAQATPVIEALKAIEKRGKAKGGAA